MSDCATATPLLGHRSRVYGQQVLHELSRIYATALTADIGCESGGGVSCFGNGKNGPKQSFFGYMVYNRVWFDHHRYAMTIGGGSINNPSRYLVLLPPINGATAASGTTYFTENSGDP